MAPTTKTRDGIRLNCLNTLDSAGPCGPDAKGALDYFDVGVSNGSVEAVNSLTVRSRIPTHALKYGHPSFRERSDELLRSRILLFEFLVTRRTLSQFIVTAFS